MLPRNFRFSSWRRQGLLFCGMAWCVLQIWKISSAGLCPSPQTLKYGLLREVNRNVPGFTQGLVFVDGWIYESTGGHGESEIRRIDPESGKVETLARLPDRLFGEGLEFRNGIFYQLTWTERLLLRWDQKGRILGETPYPYEGWGIAHGSDGLWITSDGSSHLRFFAKDPEAKEWNTDVILPVRKEGGPVEGLNELEYAGGKIYANVYGRDEIVQIDPATGCVSGELHLGALARKYGIDPTSLKTVLNGIAYRPDRGTFYVTGKNWPSIFEIRIRE